MSINNISFRVIDSFDCMLIDAIKKLEIENLGIDAALNEWQIPVIIRYGRFTAAIDENEDMIGVCQGIRCWRDTKNAFIHSFYIIHGLRGRGIGKKLLFYTAGLFKREGCDSIELTVAPENIEAVSLYKSAGFKIIRTECDEYGRGRHRYLMKLIL